MKPSKNIIVTRSLGAIKIGTFTDASVIEARLTGQNIRVGDCAKDLIRKMKIGQKLLQIELAVISVDALGFPGGATFERCCLTALDAGYQMCPPEVGPLLRLSYTSQPKWEALCVAMKPIRDSEGTHCIFDAEHDFSGLCLKGASARNEMHFHPAYQLVFARSLSNIFD